MDPEAEEETSCHWAHHLVREVLKESVHTPRCEDEDYCKRQRDEEGEEGTGCEDDCCYAKYKRLPMMMMVGLWRELLVMILIMARKLKLMTKL